MNFNRIYEYRFKDVNTEKTQIVWKEVSEFIYNKLNKQKKLLTLHQDYVNSSIMYPLLKMGNRPK